MAADVPRSGRLSVLTLRSRELAPRAQRLLGKLRLGGRGSTPHRRCSHYRVCDISVAGRNKPRALPRGGPCVSCGWRARGRGLAPSHARSYQSQGTASRGAQPHSASDFRRDRRVVPMAGTSPSVREPHAQVSRMDLARLLYLDRRDSHGLPRVRPKQLQPNFPLEAADFLCWKESYAERYTVSGSKGRRLLHRQGKLVTKGTPVSWQQTHWSNNSGATVGLNGLPAISRRMRAARRWIWRDTDEELMSDVFRHALVAEGEIRTAVAHTSMWKRNGCRE